MDGFQKALKVAGYVAASSAVAALIAYLQNVHVDEQNVIAVATVGLVNALLAGVATWLSTNAPKKK